MLKTNLKHLVSEKELNELVSNNANVMVCCGRMGRMCIPVYAIMESLKKDYPNVQFRDMEFDIPDSNIIRNHPACSRFMGLPFTVYYENGEVVKATSSIQSKEQVKEILNTVFSTKEIVSEM